jgi:hypothetical protein
MGIAAPNFLLKDSIMEIEPSALVSVFRSHRNSDELVATLAIDSNPVGSAPIGECIRVDVDALDDLPGLNAFLFRFLGTLKPIFPLARHFVAVLRNSSDGVIIFLAEPRDTDGARARIV